MDPLSDDVFDPPRYSGNFDLQVSNPVEMLEILAQRPNSSYVIKRKETATEKKLVFETKNEAGEVKQRALLNPDRFKTQMCRAFRKGFCYFEEQCQFAHGESELRAPKVHQKYKTQKCKNFAAGKCIHGNDCWFIHENDTKEQTLAQCMKVLSKVAEKEINKWGAAS